MATITPPAHEPREPQPEWVAPTYTAPMLMHEETPPPWWPDAGYYPAPAVSEVPLPAAGWLLVTAISALVLSKIRR